MLSIIPPEFLPSPPKAVQILLHTMAIRRKWIADLHQSCADLHVELACSCCKRHQRWRETPPSMSSDVTCLPEAVCSRSSRVLFHNSRQPCDDDLLSVFSVSFFPASFARSKLSGMLLTFETLPVVHQLHDLPFVRGIPLSGFNWQRTKGDAHHSCRVNVWR